MITYICVLVDDKETAESANDHFDTLTTDTFRIQAFYNGQIMHGLQHRGVRPTLILDHTTDNHLQYGAWYSRCVTGSAIRGTIIKLTKEDTN